MEKSKVEEAVKNLLIALDQDVERPGLKETPRRVAKYWMELLEGEQYTNEEIAEQLGISSSTVVGYLSGEKEAK